MKMNRVKSSFENWKSILGFRCTYKFVYNEGVEGHSPSIDRFVNPFGFTGYQRENVGGMLYAQARYYDPRNARFNAEDGARDGLNWYEYARSNPLRFVDPSGLVVSERGAAWWVLERQLEAARTALNNHWVGVQRNVQVAFDVINNTVNGSGSINDHPHIWTDMPQPGIPAPAPQPPQIWTDMPQARSNRQPSGTPYAWIPGVASAAVASMSLQVYTGAGLSFSGNLLGGVLEYSLGYTRTTEVWTFVPGEGWVSDNPHTDQLEFGISAFGRGHKLEIDTTPGVYFWDRFALIPTYGDLSLVNGEIVFGKSTFPVIGMGADIGFDLNIFFRELFDSERNLDKSFECLQ